MPDDLDDLKDDDEVTIIRGPASILDRLVGTVEDAITGDDKDKGGGSDGGEDDEFTAFKEWRAAQKADKDKGRGSEGGSGRKTLGERLLGG